MDKSVPLSELIRIGAKLRPQTKDRYFRDGASCALGVAFEASNPDIDIIDDTGKIFLTKSQNSIN